MHGRATLSAVLIWSGSLFASNSMAAEPSLEYAVKAAYLPKFVPFITWPETAFVSTASPVTICVLGSDPFGGKLEQVAASLKSGERTIAVRHLPAPDEIANCHVLFLSKGDPKVAAAAVAAVTGKAVVTVTDSGMRSPGVISFIIESNRVRFDIDDEAAAQSGLVISSKLLDLAHAVKARRQP